MPLVRAGHRPLTDPAFGLVHSLPFDPPFLQGIGQVIIELLLYGLDFFRQLEAGEPNRLLPQDEAGPGSKIAA